MNTSDNKHNRLALAKRISKHKAPIQIDVTVENCGSIFIFHAHTPAAESWIEANVSREGFQPQWPTLVVEHRYAFDLAHGMQQAGLAVR